MTLVRFNNPTMRKQVMSERFNHDFFNESLGSRNDCYTQGDPQYKIAELDDKYSLELAVPGLSKEDLSIAVENRVLTIKTIDQVDGQSRTGFALLEFSKQFRLSRKVDADGITATSSNGVLYLELPKVEQEVTKPARAIEIE